MENKKILIVDDEDFFIEPIKMFLSKNGFDVIVAHDGFSGLKKARTENPNLIILDVMLPGVNGYQICRLLKFDKRFKHIPVIIITARDNPQDKKIGGKSGADFFITKPVNPQLLAEKVNTLLQ